MQRKQFIISLLTAALSLAGGFLIANSLNRYDMDGLRQENERLKQAAAESAQNSNNSTLSEEEVRSRIAEADANPQNLKYNRDLGLALYRYAAMRRDAALLREAARLLERVSAANPNDYDLLVALGNTEFDIANFAGENGRFASARAIYDKAVAIRSDDADVRTDIALTYFLSVPPDLDKAAIEFEKALKLQPKNERALQFLIQTLWQNGKGEQAGGTLVRLKEANPSNPAIPELESLLTRAPPQR